MFIDTHTHLYTEAFDDDRDLVIQRAVQSGISVLLLPNIDADSIARLDSLVDRYPATCFGMMGLHPGSIGADWEEQLMAVEKALFAGSYIAVGEIGMDLYWDKTYVKEQGIAFRKQLQWAKSLQIPVAIHAREAFDEIFEIVDEENAPDLRGVFHCFTGNLEQAQRIIAYGGFKLGIGGVVTYKNSGLDQVLLDVDPSHLILETDSPYLPPVPYRGQRNESSYLMKVAEKLSEIYGVEIAEIERITSQNAMELFHLPDNQQTRHKNQ